MASLRASFLLTVATGAALVATGPGCTDEVVVSNPPAPGDGCPTSQPVEGTACAPEGALCSYTDCTEVQVTCNGGTWVTNYVSTCNPPPPCPDTLPTTGEECVFTPGGVATGCTYPVTTPCGEQQASASCVADEAGIERWRVALPDDCAGVDCAGYADAGLCASDSGCRWLVPGCANECAGCPPPAPEGCFPIEDCAMDGCAVGETCQTVVHDPCAGSLCNACGAEVAICVP